MGQAKTRGSFEQRKAASIERKFLESLKKAEEAEIKRLEREQRMKEFALQQEQEREERFKKWTEEHSNLSGEELEEKLWELEDAFKNPKPEPKSRIRTSMLKTLLACSLGVMMR